MSFFVVFEDDRFDGRIAFDEDSCEELSGEWMLIEGGLMEAYLGLRGAY